MLEWKRKKGTRMLEVKHISKKYVTGNLTQMALDDVSVDFRDEEFVAILGPSGSGKTTLLNIIGGLDSYDSGDLVINGTSTKKYKDRDWDAYRNHTIGFIFQSYNLIPHQTVLANVEMSLVLSNAPKKERRAKALAALDKVGLAEQAHKKPNQLSGGQMQRVAIARALVNNPDIILADEPTGALDSRTSVQVMDLLQEAAKDHLVIMVTHNPELAQQYATRIVNLKDGKIVSDTMPVAAAALGAGAVAASAKAPKKTKLGFLTALSLSLNNLLTKKGRTALTSFAGSIGIIGIALILALSNGVNNYIEDQEAAMLGNYPITLERETLDLTDYMAMSANQTNNSSSSDDNKNSEYEITSQNIVGDAITMDENLVKTNDLVTFNNYLKAHKNDVASSVNGVEYKYDIVPQVYRKDDDEGIVRVSPSTLSDNTSNTMVTTDTAGQSTSYASFMNVSSNVSSTWTRLVETDSLRKTQYKRLSGEWPSSCNEAALIVSSEGEISDYALYTLGLMDMSKLQEIREKAEAGEDYDDPVRHFTYDDVIGRTYKCFAPVQLYKNTDGVYTDQSDDDDFVSSQWDEGVDLTITCVLQATDNAEITSGIGYDADLQTELLKTSASSDLVKAQLKNSKINALTGKEFGADEDETSLTLSAITGSNITLLSSKTKSDTETIPVHFKNYDGSDLGTMYYADGEAVSGTLDGNITSPTRADTSTMTYTFIGWVSSSGSYYESASLPKATAEETYTAVYYGQAIQSDVDAEDVAEDIAAYITANPKASSEDVRSYINDKYGTDLSSDDVNALVTAARKAQEAVQDDVTSSSVTAAGIARALQAQGIDVDEATVKQFMGDTLDTEALASALRNNGTDITADELEDMLSGSDSALSAKDIVKILKNQGIDIDEDTVQKFMSGELDTDALTSYLASNGAGLSEADIRKYISQYAEDYIKNNGAALMEAYMAEHMDDLIAMYKSQIMKELEAQLRASMSTALTSDQLQALLSRYTQSNPESAEDVLELLGYTDLDNPFSISFYPVDFDGKDVVLDFISTYNDQADEDEQVTYTDLIGAITSNITKIINTISYVLIAFVAISLVVSSIMIAIITYISVLERTKEIGILRAMGTSKNGISKIFNAETFIEGLLAGAFGIGLTRLIIIPANQIIEKMTDVANVAVLKWRYGVVLIAISVVLTLIAGFLPSRMAAKKDPVTALRSE